MIDADKIYKQIQRLTSDLIGTGICDDQNFPNYNDLPYNIKEIGFGKIETNIFLKNVAYKDMYYELKKMRAFNFKMIDGAMISMQYRFNKQHLLAYRLSFFPSPDLVEFQNNPELYLEDEIYSDIVDRRIVTFPIRFDFDNDVDVAREIDHPISHLTLGQYKNCRIPVSSPLTPYHFLSFIIINFYHNAYNKYFSQLTYFKECYEESIFDVERELLHLNTPIYRP